MNHLIPKHSHCHSNNIPVYEGDGILLNPDGTFLDGSSVKTASSLPPNQLVVSRNPLQKYIYHVNRDSVFPPFYCEEFSTIEAVESALRHHAQSNGFDIRLSNVERDEQGTIIMRRFVCSCEGKPKPVEVGTDSTDDLTSSVKGDLRRRKRTRCGCGYYAVYKLRPSMFDCTKMMYRIHSLDTFHSHWRDRHECDSDSAATNPITKLPIGNSVDNSIQETLEESLRDLYHRAMTSRESCLRAIYCLQQFGNYVSPNHSSTDVANFPVPVAQHVDDLFTVNLNLQTQDLSEFEITENIFEAGYDRTFSDESYPSFVPDATSPRKRSRS